MSLEQLKQLSSDGEEIPTFAEAIEICKEQQLGAYVELKDGAALPTVVDTLRELKFARHSIVGSFRPDC